MDIKELEIQRAEELIINQLPPLARTFILNSRKINIEIEKYEKIIISIMNDNGSVDGQLLNAIIEKKYPKIAQWISIPKCDFYLKDEIDSLLQIIKGGLK